jgi:NAD+ kinase
LKHQEVLKQFQGNKVNDTFYENYKTHMERLGLLKPHYKIDSRTVLKLVSDPVLFHGLNFALNDFTIMKKDTSSMITVHVFVDGELLNSYWSDGIIVATPTGSTGYSLSCGGPLVNPKSESFILTPVSPHNLTARPIVLSDNSEITFQIEGRSKKFLISMDSRFETIDDSVKLKLKKEKFKVKLIQLQGYHYFNTLRQKLNWGIDIRN